MLRIRIERTNAPASATRRRSLTVVAATAVAVVLVGGVSYAFWTATGTGNATVASVTAQALTVSNVAVADLYPGKPAQALTFTVTNSNPYAVGLSSTITLGAVTSGSGACAASNLTLSSGPYTIVSPASLVVPAKAGATNGTLSVTTNNFVQLASGALDACQNVTFTIPVNVTGTQQ